jgi:hypothetical protein
MISGLPFFYFFWNFKHTGFVFSAPLAPDPIILLFPSKLETPVDAKCAALSPKCQN